MITYYLPGLETSDISLKRLEEMGLGYAFESMFSCGQVIQNGPDGGAGVTIAREAKFAKVVDQKWEPHQTVENCWIGYWADIKPEDLKRGSWVDIPAYIFDGWDVPIARAWSGSDSSFSVLPAKLQFKNGKFEPGPVCERYARLEEIGSIVADLLVGVDDETSELSLPDNHFQLAFEVLSMVYFLGPQEFAELGPVEYSPESAFAFLSRVADLPGWNKLIQSKKKGSRIARLTHWSKGRLPAYVPTVLESIFVAEYL